MPTVAVFGELRIRELAAQLESLPGIVSEVAVEAALTKAAGVIARKARRSRAFKDRSGRLRASIRGRKGKPAHTPSSWVNIGGRGARQASLLERGTRHIEAREILAGAVEDTEVQRNRTVERSLEADTRRVEAALSAPGSVRGRVRSIQRALLR